jgi:hypothetical protein
MGLWIVDGAPRSIDEYDAYFRREFPPDFTVLGSKTIEVFDAEMMSFLDPAIAAHVEYYAAIRHEATGQVSCYLAAVHAHPGGFAYRDADESGEPHIANCPASVLDLLTPLPECDHTRATSCRNCYADLVPVDGVWMSVDVPAHETAGAACSAAMGGAPQPHEAGGPENCDTCIARDWRRRCREKLAT